MEDKDSLPKEQQIPSPPLEANHVPPPLNHTENKVGHFGELYKRFFLGNIDAYSHLDTTVKAILWLAPGRYGDSEAMIEGAYSGLGIWNLLHDYIIHEHERRNNPENPVLNPPQTTGYLTVLSILNNIELFSEIIIQQRVGPKQKWYYLLAIETVKAWCRLMIVQQNGGKPITTHLLPSYKEILTKHIPKKNQPKRLRRISPEKWVTLRSYFLDNENVGKNLSFVQLIFEAIHILRPVFYIISIIRNGKQSWRPWLLSLILETIPIAYSMKIYPNLTKEERSESNRRIGLLLYYILRSPFFEFLSSLRPQFFKEWVEKLSTTPLIGTVMVSLLDYLDYYREHYFCISGT